MDNRTKVKIAIAEAVIGLLWSKNLVSNEQFETMKSKYRSLVQKAS